MAAVRLNVKLVEKPWGRTDLSGLFSNPEGKRIGEIWFDGPEGQHPPLLVKYIFTSEKLSIQVHPDDRQAHAGGLAGGKSECWYILDAEPGAALGIGTLRDLNADELRAAALDGSIERLMDWKPVRPGSFFYIPAGTVHAIGGGVTVIEVQQNNDVTYRLYDYGRPRELHLDAGIAISRAEPYPLPERVIPQGSNTRMLEGVDKPFRLEMASWTAGMKTALSAPCWFIPLSGSGNLEGLPWTKGECWLIDEGADVIVEHDASVLLATP